jgi:hypothetical protein
MPARKISCGTCTETMPARPGEGARTTDTVMRSSIPEVAVAAVLETTIDPLAKPEGSVSSSTRSGSAGVTCGRGCGNEGGSDQVLAEPDATGPVMSADVAALTFAST